MKNSKTIAIASVFIVAFIFLYFSLRSNYNHEESYHAAKEMLNKIKEEDVRGIEIIMRNDSAKSIIAKRNDIDSVVHYLRNLEPHHPEEGRLPGSWQANLKLLTANEAITVFISKNEYNTLVFVPTAKQPNFDSMSDFLYSKELGSYIEKHNYIHTYLK